jgi:hypothetical protein
VPVQFDHYPVIFIAAFSLVGESFMHLTLIAAREGTKQAPYGRVDPEVGWFGLAQE